MKNSACSNMKKMVFPILLLLANSPFAGAKSAADDNSRNPQGCRNVGYEFDLQTLRLLPHNAGNGQSLYFIYNNSAQNVTLYQMRDQESSHSMYFNHQINANYWAVLSTSEKKMKYICTMPDGRSQYGKIVNCADTLRVCEYTNVKFGMNNRGNYWLVNSTTKNGAINEVVRYGIIPAV